MHCYMYTYICSTLVGGYCYLTEMCSTVPATVQPLHGCAFPSFNPFAVVCISVIYCSACLNNEPETLTKKQVSQVFNWAKETAPLQSADFTSPH